MRALAGTVRECNLPRGPFLRLIEANRRDQFVTRYDSFDELLDYCQLSAAPVGELVLHVFGAATPDRIALSDKLCAGLQVIEHLQDVDEDRARGRVYIPATSTQRPTQERCSSGAAARAAARARARSRWRASWPEAESHWTRSTAGRASSRRPTLQAVLGR